MTDNQDFTAAEDPFALFRTWLADAEKSESCDPEAMALATADSSGLPNVRMVLLKGTDERGFVFYTNCESAKGEELAVNAKAALLFFWKSLGRQIRVRGPIEPVTDAEADAYFATRHPQSRIGAWASKQSRPLESRAALEEAVALYTAQFEGREIARPDYWRGFRVRPVEIEFWQNGDYRLHDRIVFRRAEPEEPWTKTRLNP
ncbi:pyridoxamine 5'-phosphate oxidase [Methyloceanibacter sp.]|uniref:pyridoxamine 5'-phosphate oxidase n=1 Tax=Methyloceanibacter sp. TaxID=1965321 RepID=UPI00208694A5|nr:pyridoxamine 5'-phosphate oxidase [Methyloceanibacter sp.]GFO80905.1 MAG: pyridoxine/pyridoxamine 5'-phosphate oxidase [Methyloceanibacter sp.]HML90862.1 pyridoxamine 5'-phosphate oxidase [Methyloceanibacter sp.]